MRKNPIYWVIGVAGALMTAFYMFRLYATTFLGKFSGTEEQEHHLHESPAAMTIPLIVLAILAVVGGFVGIPEVFMPDASLPGTFPCSRYLQNQPNLKKHIISIIIPNIC